MVAEFTGLRKSQPVMPAAGAIWAVLAFASSRMGVPEAAHGAVRDYLLEYGELLLFLLAAMTYVNAMSERGLFEALRARLLRRGLGYRALFWTTGALAFCLSPLIDNLTTALVMCAVVVLAVGREDPKFVALACINIVVAANAGGAFSPFGDITTLMVWRAGKVPFAAFFALFLPSLANWLVPALCMHAAVSRGAPPASDEVVRLKRAQGVIVALFAATVVLAVGFHPVPAPAAVPRDDDRPGPASSCGWHLARVATAQQKDDFAREGAPGDVDAFDSYEQVARGMGHPAVLLRGDHVRRRAGLLRLPWRCCRRRSTAASARPNANILVGLMSAILDNIPMMVAVLQMAPAMDTGQWLLVTFTAGVGGSTAVDRLRRRRRPDGAGAWPLHLLQPPQVGAGRSRWAMPPASACTCWSTRATSPARGGRR